MSYFAPSGATSYPSCLRGSVMSWSLRSEWGGDPPGFCLFRGCPAPLRQGPWLGLGHSRLPLALPYSQWSSMTLPMSPASYPESQSSLMPRKTPLMPLLTTTATRLGSNSFQLFWLKYWMSMFFFFTKHLLLNPISSFSFSSHLKIVLYYKHERVAPY